MMTLADALDVLVPLLRAYPGGLNGEQMTAVDVVEDFAVNHCGEDDAPIYPHACIHDYHPDEICGVLVCAICDDHKGLERCYCGWSRTAPGRGRSELIEMGETIDPED